MFGLANPDRFLRFTRPLTPVLWGLAAVLLAAGTWFSFTAPEDYQQGDTVRIMFVHVPAAWLGMAGWTGIAASGLTEAQARSGRPSEQTSPGNFPGPTHFSINAATLRIVASGAPWAWASDGPSSAAIRGTPMKPVLGNAATSAPKEASFQRMRAFKLMAMLKPTTTKAQNK